jgi:hypothetical protein
MFFKGSRYRNLPQSPHLTAQGESLLGVDLRFIPDVDGQFLHTVADRERLDLLAFKYYADPRRWWLIADANKEEAAFPLDLLDARPMVEEELTVVHPEVSTRTGRLLATLGQIGTTQLGRMGPGSAGEASVFATVVIVQYAAATARAAILGRIAAEGFTVLSTFVWPDGAGTAEAFTIAHEAAKQSWNDLIALLRRLPGIRRAESLMAAETLLVSYNTAVIAREAIVRQIERHGFAIVPQLAREYERVGAKIVIPPNQAA